VQILTADAIRRDYRRPAASGERFALLTRPECAEVKPLAYSGLTDLARAIHRRRAGRGIELVDAPLRLRGEATNREGVSVYALGEDAQRRDFIGWAWADGAGREALRGALLAIEPVAA